MYSAYLCLISKRTKCYHNYAISNAILLIGDLACFSFGVFSFRLVPFIFFCTPLTFADVYI